MKDEVEMLWRLFQESTTHQRHLEEQRSQFASVLLAVAGAIIAFGMPEGEVRHEFLPGLLLGGIGVFGMLLSWKQNEKIHYHRRVSVALRKKIESDASLGIDCLSSLMKSEDEKNRRKFLFISFFPTGLFWFLLYFLIFSLGAFVTVRTKQEANQSPSQRGQPSVDERSSRT